MRTIEIKANDGGQRLDKFLSKRFKTMPQSLMYKLIRTKRIKLNGARTKENAILAENDVLTLYISDEFFEPTTEEAFFKANFDISVVYEDANIIIVDKPAGLVVHSDDNEEINTLINRIKRYLYENKEYNPKKEASFAPALCNRIDRNTEGLVVAAKNAAALRVLNEKIRLKQVIKRYRAVVHGIPAKKSDTLTSYLFKDSEKNKVFVNKKKSPENREAITKYRVLETMGDFSLVELELVTGRTHQIRAQMAEIGHPLLGDGKYSNNNADRKRGYRYQTLCSYSITFDFHGESTFLDYLNKKTFYAKKRDFFDGII